MAINLFDDGSWFSLRPLTYTRPVADLRIGILTIAEKWAKHLDVPFGFQTQNYLSEKYPALNSQLHVNGSICPDTALLTAIDQLTEGQVLCKATLIIAYKSDIALAYQDAFFQLEHVEYHAEFTHIQFPEQIFGKNEVEINKDFELLTKGRTSAKLSSTNTILGDRIFVEEGVTAECATFNTLQGSIYLGKNSEVWEGANIRGAFALCHDSQVKMGTKIYGKTTIGPFSRVGGEINNVVIWGYSAKGHEGYLGNSVMGQWCNIGADSNGSNLKNNYSEVRLWDYEAQDYRATGLQFCGLIMADHVKCAVNTMFNTGTVVGVGANVFGGGFPQKYVPDFAWGGADGFQSFEFARMLQTTKKVFELKDSVLKDIDIKLLTHVFEITKQYRRF